MLAKMSVECPSLVFIAVGRKARDKPEDIYIP